MKKTILSLSAIAYAVSLSSASAALIAGVDFSDGAGADDATPDDLDLTDAVTVSGWSFTGGGVVLGDANANLLRPTSPVAKFNGPSITPGVAPLLGSAVPTTGVHQFSLNIAAGFSLDITSITYDFTAATGSAANRWLAFSTSADGGLVTASGLGGPRPTTAGVDLFVAGSAPTTALTGLTGSIDLIWYAGGEGSGDIDIDNIVIEGDVTAIPEPSNLSLLGLVALGGLVRRKR